ncbi:MAG TPA: hypothetical protein VJS37_16670 [Terriglobales bacterium]|nr:hypothetical protein [Terriglobales bacterium]
MARDASLARKVKEALKQAAHDLDNLKLVRPDQEPEVAQLKDELHSAVDTTQREPDS